jgi:hypothetical protein
LSSSEGMGRGEEEVRAREEEGVRRGEDDGEVLIFLRVEEGSGGRSLRSPPLRFSDEAEDASITRTDEATAARERL